MLNIKRVLRGYVRGRIKSLPLFLFQLGLAASCNSHSSSDLPPPERVPMEQREEMLRKLYPLIAGAHASRDSITSYRWELWKEIGETLYFGISRPSRSRFRGRREAVLGRAIPADTGWRYYEEILWTYKLPAETLRSVLEGLLLVWQRGENLLSYNETYVAFPDPYSFYDIKLRRWRRIIAKDTL
ncbi:MAG: hypothetical protein RMJ66_02895 [Bacteroidia bacterium]|nr:hypothetical protein [Bacteroidia bacterium]MDW8133993.1 hypothetical protein [Bacteroidia bacterium]